MYFLLKNSKSIRSPFKLGSIHWKLVVENFRECYHCAPSRPEFSKVHEYSHKTPYSISGYQKQLDQWVRAWEEKYRVTGAFAYESTDIRQPVAINSRSSRAGWVIASEDEDDESPEPLMSDIDSYDGGDVSLHIGPLTYLFICNDHLATFRFTPMSERKTMFDITWLVGKDAVAAQEYDVNKLTWLWCVTTVQIPRSSMTISLGLIRNGAVRVLTLHV